MVSFKANMGVLSWLWAGFFYFVNSVVFEWRGFVFVVERNSVSVVWHGVRRSVDVRLDSLGHLSWRFLTVSKT